MDQTLSSLSAKNWDLVILGAGPAGLYTALELKRLRSRARILLVDRLPRIGGKLRYTGGGRCNLSQALDREALVQAFGKSGRFLYPAFKQLDPAALRNSLHSYGISTLIDSEGRIYPRSQSGLEVEASFSEAIRRAQIDLCLNTEIRSIHMENENYVLQSAGGDEICSRRLVLASGCPAGKSAKSAPLSICHVGALSLKLNLVQLQAALAALESETVKSWKLAGISLPRVRIQYRPPKGAKITEENAILFTHRGLSGPAILNLSRHLLAGIEILWRIDIFREPRSSGSDSSDPGLPKRLVRALIDERGLDPHRLVINDLRVPDISSGMQCRGGISLKDLDPQSFTIKSMPGLYAVGDQVDLWWL
ncbi:MAG: NAD(P)/FAD-dependent oxidoreductase [Eubacteriales bacterium]|nr:NAD(P)/FAD-dependent oxidoreductase [Eubacteriales bacterium]